MTFPYFNIYKLVKSPLGNSDDRPRVRVFVNHIEINALLDSGSNVTVMGTNSDVILKESGLSPIPFFCTISTADGSPHTCRHFVEVPYSFQGKVKIIPTLIVPTIRQTLICGVDFWKAFGIASELFEQTEDTSELTIHSPSNLSFCDSKGNFAQVSMLQKEDLLSDEEFKIPNECECLSKEQRAILLEVKSEFLVSSDDFIGKTHLMEHRIETPSIPETEGIRCRPYPVSPYLQDDFDREIQRMLDLGVISRCDSSPWCNRTTSVAKPNGKIRICLDSRPLNNVTTKNSYPLPFITRILRNLKASKYFTTLDLSSAFWQVPLEESSKRKTAFAIIGRGLFQYERMPFGLCNAPNTLACVMDIVLGSDLEPYVFYYLDDIIITGESFAHHVELLSEVARRLRLAGHTISLEKSKFCVPEIEYCGFVIDQEGRRPNYKKVEPILSFPQPRTKKQLKQFLGMTNYLASHIAKNYAKIIAPLNDLLKGRYKGSEKIRWTTESQNSFREIKDALIEPVVLASPDFSQEFYIQTDASDIACAGFIFQLVDGERRVLEFMSHKFTNAQQRYGAAERELLGLLLAIEKFRGYVEGVEFNVLVDNAALQFLDKIKNPSGRLFRWVMRLQHFKPRIKHVKGSENVAADVLSRFVSELVASVPDETYQRLLERIEDEPENFPNFKLENGAIYKACKVRDAIGNYKHVWRLYVPSNQVKDILRQNHDDHAHLGVTKTMHRIKQFYYWPNVDKDVKAYVRACEPCKCAKSPNANLTPPMGDMKRTKEPFDFLTIDFISTLPRSRKGSTDLLVIVDVFSKFAILKPMRSQKAESLCEFMENEVFLRYGVPRVCLSDNGPCFKSNAFKKLLARYDVKQYLIANYFPQTNNTERVNRVIGDCLRAVIPQDDQKAWEDYIPKIQWALNTSIHEATKYPPFEVVFGRKPKVSGSQHELEDVQTSDTTHDKANALEKVREIVSANLRHAYERYRKAYNLRKVERRFSPGEIVFKRNFVLSNKAAGVKDKLCQKFLKCKVVRQCGPNACLLADLSGKEIGVFQLKDILKS